MSQVSILIIDDDTVSQTAMRQVLDSEGWRVEVVPLASQAMSELATRNWKLIIANIAMIGLDGPLFITLKELAQALPVEAGKPRARVLFLVPELAGPQVQPVLEREGLPYALKPFHLHDFLEKVSDLLLETDAISLPIRRMRFDYKGPDRRSVRERRAAGDRRGSRERRETGMFAAREDYMMSEEEIAEFERQEKEENERKKKKKKLGEP